MKHFPSHLNDDFMVWMEAHDLDDLPDGAWFHNLEQAAEFFVEQKELKGFHENDLAHYYIRTKG